jgi:hypothetical protein
MLDRSQNIGGILSCGRRAQCLCSAGLAVAHVRRGRRRRAENRRDFVIVSMPILLLLLLQLLLLPQAAAARGQV